jgi:hypothetical protein
MREFAAIMLDKRRKQRRGYEERREKRLRSFSDGPASTNLSCLHFFKSNRHRMPSSLAESTPIIHPVHNPASEPFNEEPSIDEHLSESTETTK